MATNIPPEMLEWAIQFTHFEKTLGIWPGMSDEVSAKLLGTDAATFRAVKATLAGRVRQAAQELLADAVFAASVDRAPFLAGSTVVGFGSSATDDSQSWFEILTVLFELRRPQDRIRFVNAGLSGDNTSQLISRFIDVVRQKPAWILCHISANDSRRHGLTPTKTLVSIEETEKNLAMLRHFGASQTDARWLWLTPTPVLEDRIAANPLMAMNQIMFRNADLEPIVKGVLKQPGPSVNLWHVFGHPADPAMILMDGLHPSLKGHQRIVRAVVGQLASGSATA